MMCKLMGVTPSENDGNISQERLEDCINSDLANNYGNLCQRVTAFVIKNCNAEVPNDIKFEKEDLKILDRYKNNLTHIRDKIDNQDINFYIDFIINSLFEANKYFNDEEPWKKKEDPIRLNTIVYTTLEIVRKISFLLYPIIPRIYLNLNQKSFPRIFYCFFDIFPFESISSKTYQHLSLLTLSHLINLSF